MKENLFLNAIALMHVNKVGGEMLNDFAEVLKNSGEQLSVGQLLDMPAREFLKTNANETMSTGQTGFGKEFVEEVVLSSELIDRLRNSSSLLAKAVIRSMVARKQDFPVRGAKVRMVSTTENTNLPAGGGVAAQTKKANTAKITLEASTLVITIYYSDDLLEDSVIAMAEYVMGEITDAYETSIHQILLNGDTATGTGNINWDGANTSTLPDGNNTDFIKFDGARKIALTKGSVVDAVGNLALENIRAARAAMGMKGLNPKDLVLVPDQQTYFELLNLTQAETIEKFGDAATVKNGVLTAIDGIEIINREELGQALATGEVSSTVGLNVTGQIVLIHAPSVNVGIRRGLTTEVSRYPEELTTGFTGSARIAVTFEDVQNTTQPTSPVALIRNI